MLMNDIWVVVQKFEGETQLIHMLVSFIFENFQV